ncbi:hypothetical protein BP5796_07705 [Coleophoma crateriformis]|uniref:DUF7932 domain-containing protein n=1 Tax=Coleophoma crateriformis TaxID=565419 RepID=A0A3D8RCP8_9HELO|nr:hypothetical protein BP5796_07705 [Coleophoma crateriformis]
MSNPIRLSVNGQAGSEEATQSRPNPTLQIIRAASATIHGADGVDAGRAIRGHPAGALVVELLNTPTPSEGFLIRTIAQTPTDRVASQTHIPPQRNVVLEAIGGDGEPGRYGGDGQSGGDGQPGVDATETTDAGPGENGGNGGAAGKGTDGADGGNGGTIRIMVDEDKTHLLQAVDWDVRGGKGGPPGEHGCPGLAGKGGSGGRGISWLVNVPIQVPLVLTFQGRNKLDGDIDVHRIAMGGKLVEPQAQLLWLFEIPDRINLQHTTMSSLQNIVTRVARISGNAMQDTTGRCRCAGGTGHCVGCEAIPIMTTRTRGLGQDGRDGRPGTPSMSRLLPGTDGRPGSGVIEVRLKGGKEHTYHSRYQLELVGFDIEDENEDGIFEPGEHLFVRRIRVRNSGGMPSPTRQTQLQVAPSEYLTQLTNNQGRTFIPQIPANSTITLPGSIKVMIREPDTLVKPGQPYMKEIALSLQAVMPGLHRRLEHFNFQVPVKIQYPLTLLEIDSLATMAQGSENKILIKVHNSGLKSFGGELISPRNAKIRMSIPTQVGSLRSPSNSWANDIIQTIGQVKPRETFRLSQTSSIALNAPDHYQAVIRVELYISAPGAVTASRKQRLVQSSHISIQVSASYQFDDRAEILVVTNSETQQDQFNAIRTFIRDDLGLKMNTWNVSLYGGMNIVNRNNEKAEAEENILKRYRGKTIILLGSTFTHFGSGKKVTLDLCHSSIVAEECCAGSSYVVLGATQGSCSEWLQDSVFPVSYTVSDLNNLHEESVVFDNKAELAMSIGQQREFGSPALQAYKVNSKSRWFLGGRKLTVRLQAKKIRSYLNSHLPQERFWVCPIWSKTGRGEAPGYVAIWHGLPLNTGLFATEPKRMQDVPGGISQLHPMDYYSIVRSLPFARRLDLLCSSESEGQSASSADSKGSDLLSHRTLNLLQFSIEEDLVREVEDFVGRRSPLNFVDLKRTTPCSEFHVQFPCLELVFQQVEDDPSRPTDRMLDLLRCAKATSFPQTKREIARSIMPIIQRRAQLRRYLDKRISASFQKKSYSPTEVKQFQRSDRAFHSRYDSNKRNVSRIVEARNSKAVQCSTHEYRNALLTTRKSMPESKLCTEQEWNKQYLKLRASRVAIQQDLESARERLASMSTLRL